MLSTFFGAVFKQPPKQTVIKFDPRLLQPPKESSAMNDQLLLDLLITKINHQLSEMCGDDGETDKLLAQLKQHTSQYMAKLKTSKIQQMEMSLIDTKNKHNQLIEAINTNNTMCRQFNDAVYSSIEKMMIVIGQMLQSRQFEPILKTLKKSIHDVSTQGLERNMTTITNIYSYQHKKYVQHVTNSAKSPIKQFQQEINTLRDLKNKNAKQIKQLETAKKQLSDKLKHTEESLKLQQQLVSQSNKEKSHIAEKDYVSKLKSLEQRILLSKQQFKQHQLTIKTLQCKVISLQKINQQQRIDSKIQFDERQSSYNSNIRKLNQEKIHLQENISQLQLELKKLKTDQALKIEEAVKQYEQSMDQLRDKADKYEKQLIICRTERDQLKIKKEGLVEKQVIKTLLQGFLDDGKQWAVKKEIQKQLFLVLGITRVEKEEPKKSGWLGIF